MRALFARTKLVIMCLLGTVQFVQAGEVLYNGIVLPNEWPPRDQNPKDRKPMPVPYLTSPPAVVPIDLGRQLFVDDFLIEKTDLQRTFHQARKFEGNPVVCPTTPYELESTNWAERGQQAVCYLGHGGVFFDPSEQLFKMFYTAGWRGGLAVATSRNLKQWVRPELGLAGGNLLLPAGPLWAGGDNCVWLDVEAGNSDERLKLLVERERKAEGAHSLHVSKDGRVWSTGMATEPADDYCSFFYNPFRRVWVFSIKRAGPRGRARYYYENPRFLDGVHWGKSVYWTNADRLDEPEPGIGEAPQLYSLNAIAYESLMLGVFYIHLGPTNEVCAQEQRPKITDLKLGFSRDGFHWDRPDRQAFIAATRREGDWDRAYLHSTTGICLVAGDWLYFPYTGFSGFAPDGSRGMYSGASVGLARLRRDGFASLDARNAGGNITTRPVLFSGRRLFANVAAANGELRVEILDENNVVIPAFSAENCQPISVDRTLMPITWHGGSDLSPFRGRAVRFRFHLRNASLYAFWVSPDENGASRGYVAAGGPGYTSNVDTVGKSAYERVKNWGGPN